MNMHELSGDRPCCSRREMLRRATEETAWTLEMDLGLRPMTFNSNPDGSTKWIFAQLTGLNGFAVIDFATRKVSTDYGLLIPERGIASRATFVVDKETPRARATAAASSIKPRTSAAVAGRENSALTGRRVSDTSPSVKR